MKKINQVVILAGGKGTRMREMTHDLPKPMVEIGRKPVLEHLINIFKKYSDFQFIICSGYLSHYIEDYFQNFPNVEVIFTGEETNTGGRILNVSDYLDERFIVTYGDGLANVNIKSLIDFHNSHQAIGTITVTNPVSRFGLVEFTLESAPLADLSRDKELRAFIHEGYFEPMDTYREYLQMNKLWDSGNAPWTL
jgi:glucose-1-phosphate cytidylyltransferase